MPKHLVLLDFFMNNFKSVFVKTWAELFLTVLAPLTYWYGLWFQFIFENYDWPGILFIGSTNFGQIDSYYLIKSPIFQISLFKIINFHVNCHSNKTRKKYKYSILCDNISLPSNTKELFRITHSVGIYFLTSC